MALEHVNGVKVLLLAGSPEAMGDAHGRCFRDGVHLATEVYVRRSEELFEVPYQYLVHEAKRCEPFIPGTYLREMRALAEASEVSYGDLLALNCVADVDSCYMKQLHQCCNFVLTPEVTSDGRLIHGRNLDFPIPPEIQRGAAICILRKPADQRIPTFSVGFGGMVGTITGMSATQMTAAEVSSPTRDVTPEGLPVALLLRQVLEHGDSLQDAKERISRTPRTCGFNLALADGKRGTAMGIEYTRSSCAWRSQRRGVLVVDNYCRCKKTALNRLTYPSGVFRYARMVQLIREHEDSLNQEAVLAFLSDTHDLATGRKSGKTYNCICNHHTAQSVVMFPAEHRVLVSNETTPAPLGRYGEIDLRQLWEDGVPEGSGPLRCGTG